MEFNVEKSRRQRVLSVIKKLNKVRKVQGKKIDILCNDMLTAQKQIVGQMLSFDFMLDFYESIIGQHNINKLLSAASQKIIENIPESNIAIYLNKDNAFRATHLNENFKNNLTLQQLTDIFEISTARSIGRSNMICGIEEMLSMGLNSSLKSFNNYSIFAVPLSGYSRSEGFILIWRERANPINSNEIDRLASVSVPLVKAIRSCQALIEVEPVVG